MQTTRILKVPTGHILIVEGSRQRKFECLSIGDYGKDVNLKCDAMGLSRDIERVQHSPMLPLEEKWVITISTQSGCSMGCSFCDVPKVGPGHNASFQDLIGQVNAAMALHPEVKRSDRLNLHYARMGEPTWNPNVIDSACFLKGNLEKNYKLHPVVSTMMPRRNRRLSRFLEDWMDIKNNVFEGDAGLQISVNSTNETEREKMFNGNACLLGEIADMLSCLPTPRGRKITLNFAVAGYEIDPHLLADLFPPSYFVVKLTPMHKTRTALEHGIKTEGDYTTFYPYKKIEESLKEVGFDVLVFIASAEEDLGRITCGNAILAGTLPEVPYTEIAES